MADISELLSNSNPEQYKKLLDLRDKVRTSQPYDAAQAEKAATESAYKDLFSKQAAQDAVDSASIPGKSAADSAKVFESLPPEAPIADASKAATEAEYGKLFGKGAVSDAVDSSFPKAAKSAAESAETLIPALTKAPGSALAKGLVNVGKYAGPVGTGLALADAAYGQLADPSEMKAQAVPGRPGYISKGSDIMRDPEVPAGWENIAKGPVPLPNGGLTGKALEDAIAKSNPNGGDDNLPTDVDPNDPYFAGTPDTNESEDKGEPSKARSPSSVQELKDKMDKFTGKTPVDSAMNSSDAIAKLLGANDKELQEAKELRDRNNLIANLSQGAATIGSGLVPLANIKPDEAFFQRLHTLANKPVEDIKTGQDLAQEKIKTANNIQQLKNAMEKEDPNSSVSGMTRDILRHAASQAGIKLQIPDTMTASNAEKILAGVENMANRKLAHDSMAHDKETKAEEKIKERQLNALKDASNAYESSRGQKDTQNARESLRLADQGMAIFNKVKNLNDLNPQMAQLVINEVGKISTGGVPGHAELEALKPGTAEFKMRQLYQSVINEPTGANVGKFMQQYKDYLQDLKKVNTDLLVKRANRIADTHGPRMGKELAANFKSRILQDLLDTGVEGDGPKVGSIEEHEGKRYMFKGGAAADKNSWELVQ